jgi:hypothetical protein
MFKSLLRKSLRFFFFILKFIGIMINYLRIKSMSAEVYGHDYKQALLALLSANLHKDMRKDYAIGAILGALQAKYCGYNKITLIEFGVAKGIGFKTLMNVADAIRKKMAINVKVIGFDNRSGLPKPKGYRDHPEVWKTSQYEMGTYYDSIEKIAKNMGGELVIGDVKDTLKDFNLGENLLAFASIDVDYYSSTKPITEWLMNLRADHLLPSTVLYFDDVLSLWTYSSFAGESLAITEFNEISKAKKIELKDKNLKLYALHNFENPYRTGEKTPMVQLHLFISNLEKYYFDKFDQILNSISRRFS